MNSGRLAVALAIVPVIIGGGELRGQDTTVTKLEPVVIQVDRGTRRSVLELPFAVTRTGVSRLLTVSRDGRWALGSHIDSWERDVLVADHFR